MASQNKRLSGQKYRAVSVGKLDRELVDQLRADARQNHRSLSGHIRALLESAVAQNVEATSK
jgi:hypothetical protein